jgi:hypothetical protein
MNKDQLRRLALEACDIANRSDPSLRDGDRLAVIVTALRRCSCGAGDNAGAHMRACDLLPRGYDPQGDL